LEDRESRELRLIETELARRRAEAADAWGLVDEVVLVGAGDPVAIPGRGDITYPFRSHSEYFYLTDLNRPGGVLAFDPGEGWTHFRSPVTDEERLWTGAEQTIEDQPTIAEVEPWIAARRRRPMAVLGCRLPGVSGERDVSERLRSELSRIRRRKDAVELARMRAAASATRVAFAAIEHRLDAGVSEFEVRVELEAAALRAGADAMAYDTIVASGPNSAVLHSAPTHRRLAAGDLVLIDAGGECRGYASDVTRTYAVGGRFTAETRDIYALVQDAQRAALARCEPGVEWRDVHLAAALKIAGGLRDLGFLRGGPESLVESGASLLFFPHGVGHLVGLGVRDAADPLPERKDLPPPFPNLRIDLPLEPRMVVTVEPGVYFIPALVNDPERRRIHRDEVAWDRVEKMLGVGGVRIEDNALITESGHESLTAEIPQAASSVAS
jgi:Xaa-Pro aminopeptidase